MFGKKRRKEVIEWLEKMKSMYNVEDEKEIQYLENLADEIESVYKSASRTFWILLIVGVFLAPAFIGIPIIVFAFWYKSYYARNKMNEAERTFAMWRMTRG